MKKILKFFTSELAYIIPIWLILILWITFFCIQEYRIYVRTHPDKFPRPKYYKEAKKIHPEKSLGVQHVYDSCDCVLLILPNGKYATIKDDKCNAYTVKFHYNEKEILEIWKFLYQRKL
jgi:hypothetical protein